MRNQSWLPDGTLVSDEEIIATPEGGLYINHLTGEERPATEDEITSLPNPDIERAKELLSTSAEVITQPEIWELLRIFGRRLDLSE